MKLMEFCTAIKNKNHEDYIGTWNIPILECCVICVII